jgi:flagellar protein FliL
MSQKTRIDLIQQAPPAEKGAPKAGKEEAAEEAGKGGGRKKLFLLIGLASVLLLGGGTGAAAYLGWLPGQGKVGAKAEAASPKKSEPGPTVKLPPLVINVKEEAGKNYVKAALVLELEKSVKAEEINSRLAALTDEVIMTLSDKRMDEVRDPAFKEKLKEELMAKLNARVGAGHESKKIRQIFFDEFLYE